MIKLFADTACNLHVETIKEHNINIVPLSYSINGVEQKYDLEKGFDGKAFYDAMRNGADMKTSMANMDLFYSRFKPEVEAGNEIIYIALAGGVSGTCHAAELARDELLEEYPDAKIAVINSLGAGLGIGMQVLEAARHIEAGDSYEAVVERIELRKHHVCQYFTVDDLKYLKKSGRVSGATAAIATVLNIKPILVGSNGEGEDKGHITSIGKCRGMNKTLNAILDKYDELVLDRSEDVMMIHGDFPEAIEYLTNGLKERGFTGNITVNYFEPICGCHVGPGSVALFFYGEHK